MTLTTRQQEAFEKLKRFISKHGFAPSSREFGVSLGITQTAAINHLKMLERKGAIKRVAGQSRTITIL